MIKIIYFCSHSGDLHGWSEVTVVLFWISFVHVEDIHVWCAQSSGSWCPPLCCSCLWCTQLFCSCTGCSMFMMFTMVMFMYMVFSIIMFMNTRVCSHKDALSHLVHDLDVLQYHVHDALSWCSQLYSWTHCFPSSCTGTAVSGNNNLVLMYGYSLATSIDLLTVAYRDLTLWTLGSDLY